MTEKAKATLKTALKYGGGLAAIGAALGAGHALATDRSIKNDALEAAGHMAAIGTIGGALKGLTADKKKVKRLINKKDLGDTAKVAAYSMPIAALAGAGIGAMTGI